MGITAQGRALIARTKNGEQLTFTKIKIGTGVLPAGETEASRTSLVNFLKDVPITSAYLKTPEQFNIKVLFSNEGITEAKKITEQGIYAKIGNEAEVLYAYFYLVDGFINLPAPTGDRFIKSVKEFGLKTSDTGNAQVVIDGLIVHPTIEDMNREIEILNDSISNLDNKKINNSEKTTSGESNKLPVIDNMGNLITKIRAYTTYHKKHTALYIGHNADAKTFAILLTPVWISGTVQQSKIKGIFHLNRGDTSGGQSNVWCEIDIQTSYNANSISKFSTGSSTLKLCTVTYNGVLFYALVHSTSVSTFSIVFEGIFGTTDSTIINPTLINDYANNGVSNVVELNTSHAILPEGFYKRVIAGVKSLLSILKLKIALNDTEALNITNSSENSIFAIDTINQIATGSAVSTSGVAGKLVKSDSAGFAVTKRTAYWSYNHFLIYGKNYLNSGTGGQNVTLPPAVEDKEVEIFNQTQSNTFLSISGTDMILDMDGNDVTARFTLSNALIYIKYMRLVGMKTMNRDDTVDSTVVWRLVEIKSKSADYEAINYIETPTKQSVLDLVLNKISALVNSSPAALDTLNELATALGNDPNFATTVTNNIATKIEKSIFTGAEQLILSTGIGTYIAKTLLEIKTLMALDAVENGANKIPVGSALIWFGSSAPSGFILLQGAIISRTTYSSLWNFANSSGNLTDDTTWSTSRRGSFSTGDGSTTFRVPDARGEALRILDAYRGLDSGRLLGTVQSDAIQGHKHGWGVGFTGQADGTTGGFFTVGDISVSGPSNPITGVITDSTYGEVRIATETRMHNIAVNLIMKI